MGLKTLETHVEQDSYISDHNETAHVNLFRNVLGDDYYDMKQTISSRNTKSPFGYGSL